ncbi:helix-turn-helix domain-containing protein [Virgibacillus necropolis]|uniref:Helix-turn-helix domain-containing protein n=1 Tax=Virgibacillus necropolis TaxID=163877 RepID=A0A221M9D3_9BACI|nr:hypothetical protein [Virgibacillus necropolis]ASN04247.1 hypothetical protein CFK40_04105 [Virgibacillus necropolis]
MDYVKQMDGFYNRIEVQPLSDAAISLWHSLMHINCRTAWMKEFTVPTITLRTKSSLSESAINRARKELKKKGYIIVQSRRGNQSPIYQIACLTETSNQSVDPTEDTIFNKIWRTIREVTKPQLANTLWVC